VSLSADALCSLTDIKGYLNIGDTYKDTMLEQAIEDATRRIIDRIGYDPHSDTYSDELYSGEGRPDLVTRARPVTSVTAVKLWDGDSYTDIDATDLAEMQVRDWYIDGVDYRFERGRSNYKVSYVAGWSDTEVAKRFRLHCMKIAALLEKESGKAGRLGLASQTFGDGSKTTYENPIEQILDDLQPYRRLTP